MFVDTISLAPFKDVFWSSSLEPGASCKQSSHEIVIATLSTGPISAGDAINYTNVEHIIKKSFPMSDDSPSSSTDEPINPKISSNVGKHIYFDEEHNDDENLTTEKIIERSTPSTIRVDSSDLISRCKDFIPLLSDTNQNSTNKDKLNENISLEKNDEFKFPDIDDNSLSEKSSKESGEVSSTTDDEKQNEIIKKKRQKKKKKKNKKVKLNDDLNQDNNVTT
ncbi:unnamed protein product [Rotaria sp. Silwood2]|nr:unnamed protein product [Rotaria sp. Silwood2]CAF4438178.1 unnamed protein product [Rotaria sp. Silwood2]